MPNFGQDEIKCYASYWVTDFFLGSRFFYSVPDPDQWNELKTLIFISQYTMCPLYHFKATNECCDVFFQLQNIMDSQYLTYIAVTNWFKLFVPCDFFVPHPQHILRCRCVQKVLPNIHCILLLTVYINGRNFFDIQYANSDARPFTPDCFSFFNTVKDCFSLG